MITLRGLVILLFRYFVVVIMYVIISYLCLHAIGRLRFMLVVLPAHLLYYVGSVIVMLLLSASLMTKVILIIVVMMTMWIMVIIKIIIKTHSSLIVIIRLVKVKELFRSSNPNVGRVRVSDVKPDVTDVSDGTVSTELVYDICDT